MTHRHPGLQPDGALEVGAVSEEAETPGCQGLAGIGYPVTEEADPSRVRKAP